MRNFILISLLLIFIGAFDSFGQMSPRVEPRRRSSSFYVDNTGIIKQKEALKSAIEKRLNEDDKLPADEFYDDWSTKGVNDGRVSVEEVPDSIDFNISRYIAPVKGKVTSRFGPRWKRYHYGIDIKLRIGEPIGSAFDGKVRITKYDRGGYGSYIVVRHENGLETVYGHLSKIIVKVGDYVRAGQTIGLGGNSGHSTGPHLHLETRFLGNPINPENFFDFELCEAKNSHYFMIKEIAFDWYKPYRKKARRKEVVATTYKKNDGDSNYHVVRKGETLYRISRIYGVPVNKLCSLNGIKQSEPLRLGQSIRYN